MHLLCDEMLRRLGRWLRAAGHDTAIAAAGVSDADLIARALREARILLTRDRHLATVAPPGARVLLLRSDGLDEQAHALRDELGLDWMAAPFTRCMLDNAALRFAPPDSAERVPESSRDMAGELRVCAACGRLYWPGGHVQRMKARLAGWALTGL